MAERFYAPTPPIDNQLTLEGDQAHHALNVMRLKAGDSLLIFDGNGNEYSATIVETAKKSLDVKIDEARSVDRKLQNKITVAVAMPKGDRQKFLVEKLVELGVHRLVPLKTNRGVAVVNEKVLARIRKNVVEASKQCGRSWLMKVDEPLALPQVAKSTADSDTVFVVADPASPTPLANLVQPRTNIIIVVGPEGGLDSTETKLLQENGWQSASMGPTILRIETAAIAAATIAGIAVA